MVSLSFDIFARDRASDTVRGIGDEVDKNAGKWDKWKGVAVGGAALAGAALFKFGKDSIAAYTDAEQSGNKLNDAYARFPALADVNQSSLLKLNSELEKKTKFDDDETAAGQATLAQYKLTGSQIKDLTPLLQDYAAKTGKDLPSAAKDLGKALGGQGKALKSIGINYKDTGDATGNYTELMGGLRAQVGGFAEKEGNTAAGKTAILSNNFGELQETVGQKLVPVMNELATVGLAIVTWIGDNSTTAMILAAAIGVVALAVGSVSLATTVWTAATSVAAGATAVWTGAQWLLTAALEAPLIPIIAVVAGVALLVAGIVWFFTQTQIGQAIVQAAWAGIQAGVDAVVGWFTGTAMPALGTAWDGVTTAAGALREGVGTAWNAVQTAVSAVIGWVTGTALPGISAAWNAVVTGAQALKAGVEGAWTAVSTAVSGAVSGVIGFVTSNWGLILGLLTGPIGLAVGVIAGHWSSIQGGANALVTFFSGLPGRISGAFAGAFDGLWSAFRGVANRIIGGWNNLQFTIGGGSVLGVDIPSFTLATPNIPYLATGGTAVRAGLAVVGEAGPELLSMPVGASVIPLPRATAGAGDQAAGDPGAQAHRAASRAEAAAMTKRLEAMEDLLAALPGALAGELLTALRRG